MIAVSVAVLLDGLGTITLEVGRFPALALVVLGAGLLLGAWWGRARGAIALGVLVLPVALVLSLIHLPFGAEIASRTVFPRRDDPFPASQQLLAGDLYLNLTRADMDGSSRSIRIEVGAGAVQLIVPRDVTVHLVADVGMGALRVTGYADRYGVDLTPRCDAARISGGRAADDPGGSGHRQHGPLSSAARAQDRTR